MHAKPGDEVFAGEPLFTLHTDTPERFEQAIAALDGGYQIAPLGDRPLDRPLIIDRITAE
jgi:thymidine phosphorylase